MDLFTTDLKGQLLIFDNPRDCIGLALKALGYSFNTTDKDQIAEATDLLIKQKEAGIVQAYVMDQIFDKMINNEAAMGTYYAGDYLTMVEENPDLAFVQPEEGSNLFVDAMCIPTSAKNKLIAEVKILRAFFYYKLNAVFRGVPYYDVPVLITEANKPRSSEIEIWEACVKDLTDAINEPTLPDRIAAAMHNGDA